MECTYFTTFIKNNFIDSIFKNFHILWNILYSDFFFEKNIIYKKIYAKHLKEWYIYKIKVWHASTIIFRIFKGTISKKFFDTSLKERCIYIYLNTACISNKINMLIPIKIGHISKIKNKKKDIYNKNMACPSKKRICISQ